MSELKYDMKCKSCDYEWFFVMTMAEYNKIKPDSVEWICPNCDKVNGKDQRQLGGNISKIVVGVGKGNFGSGGF